LKTLEAGSGRRIDRFKKKMQDHIRVFGRLRAFTPQDDFAATDGMASGEATFVTPQDDAEASCFEAFDLDRGACVYRRPADAGVAGKRFQFDGLLGTGSTQQEVYETVAASIVDGCLEGYNGMCGMNLKSHTSALFIF